MTFLRTNWRKISTAMMIATVLSVGGFKAYGAINPDDSCCSPGAPCCHPGAACCNHGAKH